MQSRIFFLICLFVVFLINTFIHVLHCKFYIGYLCNMSVCCVSEKYFHSRASF